MIAALFLLGAMMPGTEDVPALFRQARQAELRQDFTEALEKYDRVIAMDSSIAEVWTNRGLILYQLDRHRDALQSFEKAAKIKPQLVIPQLFRGIEYVRFGEPGRAVAPLETALKLEPPNLEAAYWLATAHAESQQFERAVELYRDLIQRAPDQENSRYALAIAYLNWSKATARRLVDSSSPYGKLLLAEYQAIAGFPEPAEANFRAALQALPHSEEVRAAMKQFYENQRQPEKAAAVGPGDAATRPGTDPLRDAIGNYRAGRYEPALRLLLDRANQPPVDRRLYWTSISCRALAQQTMKESVARNPSSFRAHLLLADLAKSSGDEAAARAEFESAAAAAPQNAEVQLIVVRFLATRDPGAALERAKKASLDLPTNPALNCEIGKLLLKAGSPQDARAYFERALTAEPRNAAARAGLAEAFAESGNREKAIAEMQQVAGSDPDGSWHYRLGTWYRESGRAADAREAFAVTTRHKTEQRNREQAKFLALTSVVSTTSKK
jgi:tetratricopeptide (TPR) repeat protein